MTTFSYKLRIAQNAGSGLCNQLYALSGCIDHFVESRVNPADTIYIGVDQFLTQIGTDNTCLIDDVIDLVAFNQALKPLNVVLVPRGSRLELVDAPDDVVESTRYSLEKYNTLYVSPQRLQGRAASGPASVQGRAASGPASVQGRSLTVKARLTDGHAFCHEFVATSTDEAGLYIAFPDGPFRPSPQLFFGGSRCPERFVHLLTSIPFVQRFVPTMSYPLVSTVIHLRLEQDAIDSLGAQVGVDSVAFKRQVEAKYIAMIRRHVEPGTHVLVLAADYDNAVMHFLEQSGYKVHVSTGGLTANGHTTIDKLYDGRELNAIHDLLLADTTSAKTFIGAYESSYSYTVMFRLFRRVPEAKAVIFSMLDPARNEVVYTSSSSIDSMRQMTA